MNGARTSACCFNTDVGIGSAADCLSGSWRIALVTSSVVNAEKCRKDAPAGAQLNVAGGASLMLDRTLATFSVKNWLNAWTSIAVLAETLPRPSSPSTIRHSCRGLVMFELVMSFILRQQATVHPCRTTHGGGVMTSFQFSRWQPRRRNITSGFYRASAH